MRCDSRHWRRKFIRIAAACVAVAAATSLRGAVVVIANRTPAVVDVAVHVAGKSPQRLAIEAGDCRPIFSHLRVRLQIGADAAAPWEAVEPNAAYAVTDDPQGGAPRLTRIPLGEAPGRSWPTAQGLFAGIGGRVINVKLLVDDDERRPRSVWEPAMRARLARASDVLEAHGGVRLNVVAVETWDSDDLETDFNRSLQEFEREVARGAAQVAIGFSSQYDVIRGRVHLGGTRGALHTHIMLKERAGHVLDPERLELLTHELGHFQGATHSAEETSVMRPVVGQGQLRAAGAPLRFDAANTLLVSLLGEEIREHGVRSLDNVTPDTRRRMGEIYAAINPTLPDDPAARHYLQMINAATIGPLVKDTRHILEQVVRVAQIECDRRATSPDAAARGDQLLELYVRQAALAAKQVRRENGPRAFVLALGVALDDVGALSRLPLSAPLIEQLEGETQRNARLAALGEPTMRGRGDLAKHYFVSAHLTGLMGSEPARAAGLAKELLDSRGGSGFSFRDMAANRAGIAFGAAVLGGQLTLDDIAARFIVEAFLPPVDDLREDLSAEDLMKEFGGPGDKRFADELSRIENQVMLLPAFTHPQP